MGGWPVREDGSAPQGVVQAPQGLQGVQGPSWAGEKETPRGAGPCSQDLHGHLGSLVHRRHAALYASLRKSRKCAGLKELRGREAGRQGGREAAEGLR